MCLPVSPYRIEREWVHAGLKCAVVQAKEAQHRCGYVRVPPSHPAFKEDYNDVAVDVHGGLTFAGLEPCEHEDGAGWWLGFDCAHCEDINFDPNAKLEDLSPETRELFEIIAKVNSSHPMTWEGWKTHYWLEEEVVAETNKLAEQLAAMVTK